MGMPNNQMLSRQHNHGWISLAALAQAADLDRSSFRRFAVKNVRPGKRVFPGSNGQLCMAFTLDQARRLLNLRRDIGHDIPTQNWE